MELSPGILTLGAAEWVSGLLIVGFLFCSVLLILTVLIQRPQGGGLSGAFGGGGGGSGETAFGARTGDALTLATISFFVLWLVAATGLVLVMNEGNSPSRATQAGSNEGLVTPDGTAGGTAEPTDPTDPTAEDGAVEEPTDNGAADGDTPTDDGTDQPEGEQQPEEQGDAETDDPAGGSDGETDGDTGGDTSNDDG